MRGIMENSQGSDLECSQNKRPANAQSSINRLLKDGVYTEGVI